MAWDIVYRNPAQILTGSLSFAGGASTSSSPTARISRSGGVPVDVGGAEYTVDGFIKLSTSTSDNTVTAATDASNYSGTEGNCLMDSDSFGDGRGFISGTDASGTDRFLYHSVSNGGSPNFRTIIGSTNLRTGSWLHWYIYRNATSGLLELGVGGTRERSVTGPTGDISLGGSGTGAALFHYLCKEKLNITFGCTCSLGGHYRFSTNQRFAGVTYTVPTAPPEVDANTVWLCYFKEGSGSQLGDEVHGNHGELLNSPTWSADTPYA